MQSRVILLHTKRYWPEAITQILWPFAIVEAINIENTLSLDTNGKSPLQKVAATDAFIILRDHHT